MSAGGVFSKECFLGNLKMKFLIRPKNNLWLAVQEDLTRETLREKILGCDVCISDLDDCDAKSPAKKIARENWFKRIAGEKEYRTWFFQTVYALLKKGKKAESEQWQSYVKKFLQDEEEIEKAVSLFNQKIIEASLYPGVKKFYQLLPHQHKVYLTRNIQAIGMVYGRFLGFQEVKGEVFDKGKGLGEFIRQNSFRRYLIKGDSGEDEIMLDFLEFYLKKRKIDDYVSCYRADKPTKNEINSRFNVNLGKDYSGLVEILKQ